MDEFMWTGKRGRTTHPDKVIGYISKLGYSVCW